MEITLPAAPYEVPGEIQDAARSCIKAEQQLQSAGWRECLIELASPESEEWLRGYYKFCSRLRDLERQSMRRGIVRWVPAAAALAAAAGFAVGLAV